MNPRKEFLEVRKLGRYYIHAALSVLHRAGEAVLSANQRDIINKILGQLYTIYRSFTCHGNRTYGNPKTGDGKDEIDFSSGILVAMHQIKELRSMMLVLGDISVGVATYAKEDGTEVGKEEYLKEVNAALTPLCQALEAAKNYSENATTEGEDIKTEEIPQKRKK